MATTFEPASSDILDLVEDLSYRQHKRLLDNKVTITSLFAVNANGPALKLNGWPCAAIIKVNNLKDRIEGKADSTLTIDKDWWNNHDKKEQAALIDHELAHIEFKLDKKTEAIKMDDIGRPLLRLRRHDFQVGGFYEIGMRHGTAATEAQIVLDIQKKWMKMGFDFAGNDMKPHPETRAIDTDVAEDSSNTGD